jgi:hypothetical protein
MSAAAPVALKRVAPGEVKALSLDPVDDKTREQAGAIVSDVKLGGEAKLLEIAVKFGDIKPGAEWQLGTAGWRLQMDGGRCLLAVHPAWQVRRPACCAHSTTLARACRRALCAAPR